MKNLLLLLSIGFLSQVSAQNIGNFENPALVSTDTSWYGQDQVTDGDTIYDNNGYIMELNYDAGWGSYSGWAVSNMTDDTTPGWANQFSSITGGGEGGSDQYGVCFATPFANNRLFYEPTDWPVFIPRLYVTNTAYAYYSMLDGDSFAKKFGEDTSATGVIDGTDGEDWFLLTIYELDADSSYTGDSVNFYLADYRFADDADDYIIDEWTMVDLSSLNNLHGLDFVLTSSDTSGGFGMNTPAYFAMDNIEGGVLSLGNDEGPGKSIYPNPFTSSLNVELEQEEEIQVIDMNGRLMYSDRLLAGTQSVDLSILDKGMYILLYTRDGLMVQERIIKQ